MSEQMERFMLFTFEFTETSGRCPLCDQVPEDISHLLVGCSVHGEVWWQVLRGWDKLDCLPELRDSFVNWWSSIPLIGNDRKQFATSNALIFWAISASREKKVAVGSVKPSGGRAG
ncbi:hypothetical protein BRADI_2g02863v3 [Brachypodium distachyon]|uniref:Uncharacterized protein n=1 Tax=Brachypodium distachyon TaxID=15368 RepID=A0A0Q3ME65_BRADI|nr:hypothetical protein BRADI_2g02863v3 [Brachypodium distachyon]